MGGLSFWLLTFRHSSPKEGLFFALAFIILGCFRISMGELRSKPGIVRSIRIFWSLLCLFAVCIYSLDFIDLSISANLGTGKLLLNLLCAFVLYLALVFILGNTNAALTVSVLVLIGLSTVNGLVFLFRGKEFCAVDILSAKTALNVAGQYTFNFPHHVVVRWCGAVLAIFSQFSLPVVEHKRGFAGRLAALLLIIPSVAAVSFFSKDIDVKTWEYQGSQLNGFYLNFVLGIRDSVSARPAAYSPELVDDITGEYASPTVGMDRQPNVIVIMNEAFSDLDIFTNPLPVNRQVTPFISSIGENIISGHALASVFAGNTANSEFEMLTGHTMGFFPNPSGSVPYQQYISEPIFCLPHVMNSMGYTCFATHPFHATGWSRDVIYPKFGFAQSTFLDAYPEEDLIREFVSDDEMYEYVLNLMAENDKDTLVFIFGVTMQNHSSYDVPNYENSIELDDSLGSAPLAEQYLSLIHESDKAVEHLLSKLESYPKDTVVLFFGDHMPRIEDELYLELNGGPLDTLDEQMKKYTVPFFIWANYDIEEYTLDTSSLNYLAGHLLDAAGIELPPYYQFLRDIEETIPAINAFGYYSKSCGSFIPFEEAEGEEAEALRLYECVQYNNLFDAKNRNELFFAQYLK